MRVRQWGVMALLVGCKAPAEMPMIVDSDTGDVCSLQSDVLLGPLEHAVLNLIGQGEWVAWTDRAGPTQPTVLNAIRTDGAEQVVLHRSIEDRSVVSTAFAGDQLVFLETEYRDGPRALYVTDLDGATARRVAVRTWGAGARLVGADGVHAFVIHEDGDDVAIDRIEIQSGKPARVGQVRDVDAPTHLRLAEGSLWFRVGGNGGNEDPGLYRLSSMANGRDATRVGTIGSDAACQFPAGGLAVTPSALVCGRGPVFAFDAGGTSGTEILHTAPGTHVVVGSDGESVFAVGLSDSTFDVRVSELSSDGTSTVDLACDARKIPNQHVDAAYPDSTELQAVVTDDAVVWIDTWRGRQAGQATITMRRAAR